MQRRRFEILVFCNSLNLNGSATRCCDEITTSHVTVKVIKDGLTHFFALTTRSYFIHDFLFGFEFLELQQVKFKRAL
jgi:hypothetical protein